MNRDVPDDIPACGKIRWYGNKTSRFRPDKRDLLHSMDTKVKEEEQSSCLMGEKLVSCGSSSFFFSSPCPDKFISVAGGKQTTNDRLSKVSYSSDGTRPARPWFPMEHTGDNKIHLHNAQYRN